MIESRASMPRDVNRETGEGAHRERHLVMLIRGFRLVVRFNVPLYIDGKLKSADWERVHQDVCDRADRMLREIEDQTLWTPRRWPEFAAAMDKFARQRVYELFCDYQQKAGNAAWEIPASLQAHTLC